MALSYRERSRPEVKRPVRFARLSRCLTVCQRAMQDLGQADHLHKPRVLRLCFSQPGE